MRFLAANRHLVATFFRSTSTFPVHVSRPPLCRRFSMFSVEQRGSLFSESFRLFFKNAQGHYVSPMHDIPLKPTSGADNEFHMVVEVPRWTNAKMEINLKEKLNPIKQDVKKGKPRFVANCFPHKGYIWNYGAIPQTWEDPDHLDADTKCKGDGDPIDVCEIGSKIHARGAVIRVKVLGVVALIDEGETDWKVLAIDLDDPLAAKINDIRTMEAEMPGLLAATVEWFRIYKKPDGKPENQFAFEGKPKDAEFAIKVVNQTHNQWVNLMKREADPEGLSRLSAEACHAVAATSQEDAKAVVELAAPLSADAALDCDLDKWFYTANL